MLSRILDTIPVGNGIPARNFEDFCTNQIVLKFIEMLFSEIKPQYATYAEERIFDLVGILKSPWPPNVGLPAPWDSYLLDFNSRIIIFEFKNFSNAVPRTEVLKTNKYLSKNAKRNVALLFCRNGLSTQGYSECQAILREYGKLIVPINVTELVEQLDNGEDINQIISDATFALLMKTNQ